MSSAVAEGEVQVQVPVHARSVTGQDRDPVGRRYSASSKHFGYRSTRAACALALARMAQHAKSGSFLIQPHLMGRIFEMP